MKSYSFRRAMSFGTEWGWGTEKNEARKMLDLYIDHGGNFVDTANVYTNGSSEKILGECLGEKRQQIVLSTKYTMNTHPGDPNGGGNHRKSMVRSVETSLQRLKTDYIDLLYLHMWDDTTPVEEILRAMDDLVRAGKVLYAGMSNTPAWQISRMQAIADLRGWSPLVALQIEYNLIERTTERELIPMANEMGLGVVLENTREKTFSTTLDRPGSRVLEKMPLKLLANLLNETCRSSMK
jgi:aryl-alcohol dehydrogenase-like predicted oxidoreductase